MPWTLRAVQQRFGSPHAVVNRLLVETDSPETCWTGRAHARAGLLGNPSDGYGGIVLAMTIPDFTAHVTITSSHDWDTAGNELLGATVEALRTRRPTLVEQPASFAMETTIPRQVGLSGSSAIIIAALRSLAERAGHQWDRVELARTALEVETQVLGWTAGPQDRVVQAYEGLVYMGFATPWHAPSYEQLAPTWLPPLFIAWNKDMGEPSDVAHSQVRERWLAGDPTVVQVMRRFAQLAVEGRIALDAKHAGSHWPALMNEAFELRSKIWPITDIDTALVETGQALGAGVAFAGSGGAVVGSVIESAMLKDIGDAYRALGAGFHVIRNDERGRHRGH